MTPSATRAFGLDAVRALAVTSVLVAHGSLFSIGAFPEARYLLVIFGVCGVEIFFALSGFLVGRQLLRVAEGGIDARAFLMRRWYRTLPNYYLFLAVNAAIALWITHAALPDAKYLVFAQSLAWPATPTFFPESWSLAIEEWFYLIAALAFALAAWRRVAPGAIGIALLAVVVAGPVVRYLAQAGGELPIDEGVRKISLLRLDALAFGVGAAWIERYRAESFRRLAGPLPRIAAVVLVVASIALIATLTRDLEILKPASGEGLRAMASVLFSALPLATALWLPWLATWISWDSPWARPVSRVADWSYAIYLTHFPTLLAMLALWPVTGAGTASLALRTAVWLLVSVSLAAAVYRWYEHPLTIKRPGFSGIGDGARKP